MNAVGRAVREALTHRRRVQEASPFVFSRIRSRDTYLISFPRSGNTWLRCLLTALVQGTTPTPELIQSTVPDAHRSDRTAPPPGRWGLVKSHAPFMDIPARVVYLVRDGREAMLSYWAHQRAVGRIDPALGLGTFIGSPGVWPCPWHEHVAGWLDGLAARPPERWLILRYEDLEADPATHLARVAAFAGLGTTKVGVAEALRLASREALQAVEASAGPGSLNHVSTPRSQWPADLSSADIAAFMATAAPVLWRLGYAEAS